MGFIKKIRLFILALEGELIKLFIRCRLLKIPHLKHNSSENQDKVTVSLTSYGRRVSSTVYYTLISLLRQTHKPSRILLWLDKNEWSIDSIPKRLKDLVEKGIEIKFCENIKSYKKLIPTLIENRNTNIITVDDDIFYPRELVEEFLKMHHKYPNNIISNVGHKLKFKNGKLLPYNEWELDTNILCSIIFPTGAGGVLYPAHSLNTEITDEKIFMKLAPNADDVWFFFMAYLNRTKVIKCDTNLELIPVDLFYQKFHIGSSLRDTNCGLSHNDLQIRNVMKHYKISDTDLELFCKS